MPDISIQFTKIKETSLQVGDIAYYANPNTDESGGFKTITPSNASEKVRTIGKIKSIDQSSTTTTTITCEVEDSTPAPTTSSFIFFAKDNRVNTSSLLGYYGSATFKNNSTAKAELFSVGCEISESSK